MSGEASCERPIFIVGNARSGTTLLARLLDAHSRLAIYDESHFFYFFGDYARRLDLRCDDVLREFLDLVFETRLHNVREAPFAGFDRPSVRARIEASERTLGAVFAVLMDEWCRERGKLRWGDKSPMHLFEIDAIASAFPSARFVHIVRDPRAVVASIRLAGMSAAQPFHRHADMWRYSMQKGNGGFRRMESGQLLELHYEDLVTNGERCLRRTCAFLGEAYEPQMLVDYRSAGDANANLVRARPDASNLERPINQESLEKWRRSLSARQRIFVEELNARWMRHYGYLGDVGAESVDLATRLFARGYRISAPVRDYVRKQRWRRLMRARYVETQARLRQPPPPRD